MSLERIAAIALPSPAARMGAPRPGPTAGETLRLTLGPASADEVLASTSDRRPFRLAGLAAAAPHVAAGDVILVRVLSTHPRLEFALLELPGRQPHDRTVSLPNAMRPDQLAHRRMSWRAPDAAAVAQSWRAMVLRRVGSSVDRFGVAHTVVQARSGSLAQAAPLARDGMATLSDKPSTHVDRWLFPAYVWGGLHLSLRLIDPDDARSPPTALPRRRRGPMALRLEVELPALGRVAVLVRLLVGSVQLVFFIEDERALRPVHDAMPMLSRALSASGLRLARCGLTHGIPRSGAVTRLDERGGLPPAQLLPLPLFQAAAEVAVALSALLPPGGFSPVARPT